MVDIARNKWSTSSEYALGHVVGRGHVGTLMRKMGIEAIYCKPRTTRPQPGNKTYPYLLRNMEINRANHVWAADITYLPMARGFCYLVAIMDWASRRVLAWRLSNTLDVSFCLEALEEALASFGSPEISPSRCPTGSTPTRVVSLPRRPLRICLAPRVSRSAWTARGAG